MRVLLQLMCLAIGLAPFADGRFGDGRVGDQHAIGERWLSSLKHHTLRFQRMLSVMFHFLHITPCVLHMMLAP